MTAQFVRRVGTTGARVSQRYYTVTVEGPATSPIGNTLIVAGKIPTFTGPGPSVTDSQGNVWTVDHVTATGGTRAVVARTVLTAALSPGDTITIDTGTSLMFVSFTVLEFAGLTAAPPVVVSSQAVPGSSTSFAMPAVTPPDDVGMWLAGMGISINQPNTDTILADIAWQNIPTGLSGVTGIQLNWNGVAAVFRAPPSTAPSPPVTWTWPNPSDAVNVGGGYIIGYAAATPPSPPPTVTTETLPDAQVGAQYQTQLTAQDGQPPYSWDATGLPAGLSINTAGIISGVPNTAGTYQVTVTVTDENTDTDSATLPLVVQPPPPPALEITTQSLPAATVGQPYMAQLIAAGGTPPYTWSATGLPPGLSISTGGTITGVPTGETP